MVKTDQIREKKCRRFSGAETGRWHSASGLYNYRKKNGASPKVARTEELIDFSLMPPNGVT
jgi:hypothetical protein